MANTILITANWHTGALSQQTISRQYDNNRYVVQFVGYPEASDGNELDYYLLVWMSSAPGETPDEIAPIQLASDQWYISNVFTQQTQQIKFQMCALNTDGTFEAHSPIFTGFVHNSLEHDGTTQDIDVSTLFDAYREYLNELIIRAGAVVIDPTLTQPGQAADAKVVGDAISGLENGEYVLISGTLLTGFYPLQSGTIGTSPRARMVVFPIKEDKTYYVTWLEGTNMYRTAFGDTAAEEIVLGTPIYDYVDNRETSHERYPRKNTNHKYLYVYIGSGDEAAALTAHSVKVSTAIPFLDSYMAADGDSW